MKSSQALVGLKDVRVLRYERAGPHVELMVEQVTGRGPLSDCAVAGPRSKNARWCATSICPSMAPRCAWPGRSTGCAASIRGVAKKSWVLADHRIAAKNCLLTTRAAKWATVQVGGGRTVSEVAAELACDWHTVNDAVTTYGEALLEADRKRLNQTSAIGLDETSFVRLGPNKQTSYATTVADVENHQIIDILPTRKYVDVAGWIDTQPAAWKERIRFGALDMSATYAAVYTVILPKAAQVVDPFHVIALANRCLDGVRRRVQNRTDRAPGSKRRSPLSGPPGTAHGRGALDDKATARLASLLELGDPGAEVAIAYRVKERLRDFYDTGDLDAGAPCSKSSRDHCVKRAMPPEIQKLGRTIRALVRQDLQLPPGQGEQRSHRVAQQPDQAHQAHRLRVPQLRELPDPGSALRRQAELASARLDRGPACPRVPRN